jgi:hypothetical protein
MVSALGDTTSFSSNNVFTSSSSCIYPLPFLPLPFRCISSSSSRIRQRYYRIRLSTIIINCTISSLNKLYSNLSYHKTTLFETASSISNPNSDSMLSSSSASSSSFSSVPSLIHQRVLQHLSSCVRTFIKESRGSGFSTGTSDINNSFSSSFPLSSIYHFIANLSFLNTDYSHFTPPTPTSSVPAISSLSPSPSIATSLPTSFPFSPSSSYFHSLPVAITPLVAATVSLPTNTTSVNMVDVLPLQCHLCTLLLHLVY